MNVNDIIMIKGHDLYDKKPARILEIISGAYRVSVLEDGVELILTEDEIKKKKFCSCSKSQNMPFCDSSHMRS